MTGPLWFNGWESIGRIVLFSIVAYVLLIGLVRWFGHRTISKMNPSDFVVTVAIGSIVANFVLQSPASVADGVAAITTMLVLQIATEWATTRSETARKASEGAPVLLVYHGQVLRENLEHENVNEHELLEAVRQHGFGRMADVNAVVLEIDGGFSVLPWGKGEDTLANVRAH
ncbi:MAG TPA: YetF domain-containing protein [Kofleriaceae bacterium]|nr:YetF domain-containing protein [Kofleriaceae bacterium]